MNSLDDSLGEDGTARMIVDYQRDERCCVDAVAGMECVLVVLSRSIETTTPFRQVLAYPV